MRRRYLLLASCLLPVALGALAQAEAERQIDEAIARLRGALGPDNALEWRGRSVDPVSGAARLEGVTLRRGPDRLTAAEVTLERLRADGVGHAVLSDLRMEGVKHGGTNPVVITAGRVTLGDLVLPARPATQAGKGGAEGAVDWGAASVQEAVAEGLRMDASNEGSAELGRLSVAGYAPGTLREAVLEGFRLTDRRDGETRLGLGRARLSQAVVPRIGQPFDPWALAADAVLIEGAELSVEKESVAIRLGRAQVDGWGEGKLTTLAVEGVGLEGTTGETGPFTAELGRVGLSGVALRDLSYGLAHDINPPQPAQGQEQLGAIEGLAVSTGGTPLLRIGAIRARNGWDAAAPGIQTGTMGVEGFALDIPAEMGGDWLDGMGFKRILAQMAVATRMVEAEGRLQVDPFTLQAERMGRLGLVMDMRGVRMPVPGQPSATKDDPFAAMAGWMMAGFTLRYTDEGLVRTLIARQAAEERVPERQLRERYAQMALRTPLPGAASGKETPGVRSVREAWAGFARDLGTIEISIRPPKPLPMMDFLALSAMPPDRMVRQLNITATARPPAR